MLRVSEAPVPVASACGVTVTTKLDCTSTLIDVFHVFRFRSPQFELFNFDVPGFGAKKPFAWSTAIVANDRLAYCACF